MYYPVEAEPSNIFLGLPYIVWGILIGCFLIFLLILGLLFFYFYFLPRHKKNISSQTNYVISQQQQQQQTGTGVQQSTSDNGSSCMSKLKVFFSFLDL